MCTDLFTVTYKYHLRESRQWTLINGYVFRMSSFCDSVETCLSEQWEGDLQCNWKVSLFPLAVEQGERARMKDSACT